MATSNIKRMVTRRLPILKWINTYNPHMLMNDCIAGLTVGLVLMPQSLANAALAGMEPQYGLYAAFIGGFIYCIFGTSKNITIGPEAVICIMTYQQIGNKNVDYAVLLCFLTGAVQLCMVIFRLDLLMDFFSIPVTAGYISAASIIIASSQLKDLFGLNVSSSGFLDDIMKVVENVTDIRYADLALGVTCIISLLSLRALPKLKITTDKTGKNSTSNRNNWTKILRIVANSRNIIVILTCAFIAFLFEKTNDSSPFTLTGKLEPGLPSFQIPPFQTVDVQSNRIIYFGEMLSDLGSSIILVPVVSAVTNIAIVKSFAINGKIDGSQELFCISLINIFGSFFSSMPVTASFSRSAINQSSGVETQAGGIVTSLLVLLSLGLLTPYLFYIPKTSLAAMIISAIIFMLEYHVVKPMWRSNKKDFFILVATFFTCLFYEIQYGILVGVIINIFFLLQSSARPIVEVVTKKGETDLEYLLITPKGSLYFPSAEYVNSIIEEAVPVTYVLPVVINCQYMMNTDFTAAKGISYLIEEFLERKQPLYFVNIEDSVVSVFQNILKENFIFFNSLKELETMMQGERFEQEKVHGRRVETIITRKYSVPLTSIISTEAIPSLKRRYSSVQR